MLICGILCGELPCVILNKSPAHFTPMTDQKDFERFASYLGFNGLDADMFYEAYYELDSDDEEYETITEESYESAY